MALLLGTMPWWYHFLFLQMSVLFKSLAEMCPMRQLLLPPLKDHKDEPNKEVDAVYSTFVVVWVELLSLEQALSGVHASGGLTRC